MHCMTKVSAPWLNQYIWSRLEPFPTFIEYVSILDNNYNSQTITTE